MVPHLHFEVVKAWPLASTDIASRYDVLQQLALGGVVLSGETLTHTGVSTAYNEPRLRQAKTFATTGANFDPTGEIPNRASKWPIYVGFGGLVLMAGLIAWGGSRSRDYDELGRCRCAGGWGQPPKSRRFQRGQRVRTPLGSGHVAYQRMRPPEYNEAEAVSVVLEAKQNKPGYTGTIFRAEDVIAICGALFDEDNV
jgi:hypothetical protein